MQTVVWFHCGRSLQSVTISNSVSLSLMMKQLVAVGARYVLMSSSGSPEQLSILCLLVLGGYLIELQTKITYP